MQFDGRRKRYFIQSFRHAFLLSSVSTCREGGGPTLSTTRPIQKTLSRQASVYSEDLDNVMNSKLVTQPPTATTTTTSARSRAGAFSPNTSVLNLANSTHSLYQPPPGPEGSLMPSRATSMAYLTCMGYPRPEHATIDMPPMFPSHNAILQSETGCCCILDIEKIS